MNKEWSEMNKAMQACLKKEAALSEGIETLLKLRGMLMNELERFKTELSGEEFNAIPFINADGYHSKTIAYSIWHIFRIEDIVANSLITGSEQVFFSGNYKERTGSPIITTGNELAGRQIADFSQMLDLDELYRYIDEVKRATDKMLKSLSYSDLKRKMTDESRRRLETLEVVSTDDKAFWLIDYWCKKDIRGLIQMPFSRHWIMHIEACLRIINRIHPD